MATDRMIIDSEEERKIKMQFPGEEEELLLIQKDRELHPWLAMRPWKRHSTILMVCGLIYIGTGLSYILAEPTNTKTHALEIALNWWSLKSWGIVFVLAGVLSIISSRWPPISKTWGYMVLTGLSGAWSAFYFMGIVFVDSPWTNFSGVTIWGLVAFMWWAVSGLRNPGEA